MAIDHRIGSKVGKNFRREEAPATRVEPYPYIGIVKNNIDPTRSGRLQVWVPDFGGEPDDPKFWRTVSYASPYMGTTQTDNYRTDLHSKENKFTEVPHTYGMWMVPPDIGVEVIIIFIGGDANRGYWLACVNSNLSRYMLPALGSSQNYDDTTVSADIKKNIQPGQPVPVAEFNENNPSTLYKANFINNLKPVHDPQYRILKEQGLDRDTTRGPITSSSQRESPSNVFGISTPGRPYINDPANNPAPFLEKLAKGTATPNDYRVPTRKGGHSFVMDDGSLLGDNQLVRLRTSNGHQILMHDTDNTIYISHAEGTSWVELTDGGAVNIYSAAGVNVRSQGTINMHADKDINMHAKNKINIRADANFQVDAGTINLLSDGNMGLQSAQTTTLLTGASLNVQSGTEITLNAAGKISHTGSLVQTNSGAGKTVSSLKTIFINKLPDVSRKTPADLYVSTSGILNSIVTVAPTHEPYSRGTMPKFQPLNQSEQAQASGVKPSGSKANLGGLQTITPEKLKTPATDEDLRLQKTCDCKIGNLTADQVTAYFAQIGRRESGNNYQAVNTIGFVGKYQFGALALIDLKFVKSTCRSNSKLNDPNNWLGKDGITSLQQFLASLDVQDAAMCAYTKMNYNSCCRIGVITPDMTAEEVAGVLAVSHLLGPGGAKTWAKGGGGADAYGTTGSSYFQTGKYAIAVLAPKLAEINAG